MYKYCFFDEIRVSNLRKAVLLLEELKKLDAEIKKAEEGFDYKKEVVKEKTDVYNKLCDRLIQIKHDV